MDTADHADPLVAKLVSGLERLALALTAERRRAAEPFGLNATQASILRLLSSREPDGLRVGAIADQLGVRQPTATDSIKALERKGLVRRAVKGGGDIRLSVPLAPELSVARMGAAAVADLTSIERVQLLRVVIKLIRSLQLSGAIAPQRLCVSCQHFRPNVHDNPVAPHHCALVDAAFGDAALRLDCADHLTADAAAQAAAWTAFNNPPSSRETIG